MKQVCCLSFERRWHCLATLEGDDTCVFTMGLHPHETSRPVQTRTMLQLQRMIQHPKCVGIGEVGLDYHTHGSSIQMDHQKDFLSRIAQIAVETRKPLVIHARFDSDPEFVYKETLEVLKANIPADHTVYLHCFCGSLDHVELWTKELSNMYLDWD